MEISILYALFKIQFWILESLCLVKTIPKNQRNLSNFQSFDILYLIENPILDTSESLPREIPGQEAA